MNARIWAGVIAFALLVGGNTGGRAQTAVTTQGAVEPSMAFGSQTVVALRSNGDVLTWGNQSIKCLLGRQAALGQVDPNPGVVMHNVKEIAAAGSMHLALTADGKVYGWGAGLPMGSTHYPCDGPALVPSLAGLKVTHIGVIAGFTNNDSFAVAVTDTGDLYCWGSSYSCPAHHSRTPDSAFRAANADLVTTFTRLDLPELHGNVLDIRLGEFHTLVLTKDRKLYAFGRSRWGQLGDSRFTQGGVVYGFTPNPVLTNVVSFAAGTWHSVAVKDDGTVWTWGHNEEAELCDGTTTNRRVPTQLAGLSQVVQVAAAARTTFMRTKGGVIYACGNNAERQLTPDGVNNVPRPTEVPVPVAARSSVFVPDGGAFSADGCAVYFAEEGFRIRGTKEPQAAKFRLRAGLSLCAPPSATRLPDLAERALRPLPPVPKSVDCWIPKVAKLPTEARLAPLRQALLTTERLITENSAFVQQLPEGARLWFHEDAWRLTAYAYPRDGGPYTQWTTGSCNVLGGDLRPVTTGDRAPVLGQIDVVFNGNDAFIPAQYFPNVRTPDRIVAGFPVYRHATTYGITDYIVITNDGRLPVIPVTLADRLDFLAESLKRTLEDEGKQQATQAAVQALRRERIADLQRQVEALRAYRASFSVDELRAAWVEADGSPQGAEWRQLDARVKALEALSPEEQAQVNDLGTRARALQRQATTRGTTPAEAARLRSEANTLLNEANAIVFAQRKRVAPQVVAMRSDFQLRRDRPGDASQARDYKDDPDYYDKSDPSRIRMILVVFSAGSGRDTSPAQAKAWMDRVEATFDYAALKALIR